MKGFTATVFSLLLASACAFAPNPGSERASVSLAAAKDSNNGFRTAAASAVAAVFIAASAASPAFAVTQDNNLFDFGSSDVIAARSGGRAGGRASSRGASSSSYRSPSSSTSRPSTTYRSSTTIIRQAPSTVYVSPPPMIGYGYQPPSLGGLVTGYALGSMGNNGNNYQDMRQEQEIKQSRYELEQARMKEAELEGRLRALEQQPR
mmetsp:Transcript_20620/g.26581  ORF Transcript_20620/g.26581 Transcript_20620/m.26581 type:complete len:206 (+) Transcript_20620:120-737(+)|eukprot:CAMPEP_0198145476 /NCGR_PEP_ID=MMETSP1443-20131203/23745_1 /TAXON_ID=186043 /ORGANISM="Entomoneis sp., Strain CCMP2396" /LENGTH=205 /DNA_ID=CAMNT_0043809139 /DNA_START=45 /DNA_END=662 /DNA_ORIENTATION=+